SPARRAGDRSRTSHFHEATASLKSAQRDEDSFVEPWLTHVPDSSPESSNLAGFVLGSLGPRRLKPAPCTTSVELTPQPRETTPSVALARCRHGVIRGNRRRGGPSGRADGARIGAPARPRVGRA